MAWYQQAAKMRGVTDRHFDDIHEPGATVEISGIYECIGCGREYCLNERNPFPPQNHHQHTSAHGAVRWRLLVWSDSRASEART